MSTQAIHAALQKQGLSGNWRGPAPAAGAEINQTYLDELVGDLPRLTVFGGTLDVAQLAADFDTAKALLAARAAAKAQREADAATTKANNQIRALINADRDQIEAWITNNVTDLASARQVLIRLAQALSAVARESFVDE